MYHRVRGLLVAVLASVIPLTLAACGSSSGGDATTLLNQTFSGSHVVNSGNLSFSLTVIPRGSNTLTGPITLSFGGPFQSMGKGKLPASNFRVSISALGKTGSLGILSTGKTGYVTLQGTNYRLPAATYQKLESSFEQVGASGATPGSGGLSALGIDPMHWLVKPSVAGTETVAGADTTHIRAGINVPALLADISTFLTKASSLGASGAASLPKGMSAATRARIASQVKNPAFDVWTGNGDKTVRKLSIVLTLPVTGNTSAALGGLSSAQIGLQLQYADLNKPQTIVAPTTLRPYSEFSAKLQQLLSVVQTGLGGGTVSSVAPSQSSGAGSTAQVRTYSQCLQAAGGDVAKMQKCAGLRNK
jgi:hypothetical protein